MREYNEELSFTYYKYIVLDALEVTKIAKSLDCQMSTNNLQRSSVTEEIQIEQS